LNDHEFIMPSNGTLIVPVLPGDVTVIFKNTGTVLGATATLTISYQY
jgi:hypothetical protein